MSPALMRNPALLTLLKSARGHCAALKVDVSDYTANNEWEILSHPARKNVKYYTCCREPYPDLTFTVSLRRVAAFYNYVLVLPCVLLSFLTLVIFWLPPESPAKMMLGTSRLSVTCCQQRSISFC